MLSQKVFNYILGGMRLILILVPSLWLVSEAPSKNRGAMSLDVCVPESFFSDSNFAGIRYAWVVPLSGKGIFLTRNGGENWEHVPKEEFHGLRLISFIDVHTGWTIGEGKVWKTVDSGKSWRPVSGVESGVATLQRPRRLLFLNRTDGIILEAYKGIWVTHDGGVSWEIFQYKEAELVQAYPIDSESVLIETSDKWILNVSVKKDRITWKKNRLPRSLPIIDSCFVSSELGWIVCENAIFKTKDGGSSWVQQPPMFPLKEGGVIQSIHFINDSVGWACATSSYFLKEHDVKHLARKGFVFKTNDGGQTWQLLYEKPGHPFDKVYFGDSKNGWILADDKVLRSVDGGVTWFQVLDMKSPSKCK